MNDSVLGDEFLLYLLHLFHALFERRSQTKPNKKRRRRKEKYGTLIYSPNKQQLEHNKTNDMNRTRIGSKRKKND